MELPQCAYVFRATVEPSSEEEVYQLEGICRSRATLDFTPPRAHQNTLADNDWSQLQLLNARLVSAANALSLRFVFITRDRGVFVCALTRTPAAAGASPLRVMERLSHYDTTGAELPYVDGETSIAHGAPVYSLLYSFLEEAGAPMMIRRYAFEGVSPIVTRIVGVPLFLNSQRLHAMHVDWIQRMGVDAPQHSRCHVRRRPAADDSKNDEEEPLRWLHSADGFTRGGV